MRETNDRENKIDIRAGENEVCLQSNLDSRGKQQIRGEEQMRDLCFRN